MKFENVNMSEKQNIQMAKFILQRKSFVNKESCKKFVHKIVL